MGDKGMGGKSAVALGYMLLVIGGLAFGCVCFLGGNFRTFGAKTGLSVFLASLQAAILIALAVTATRMKHAYKNFGVSLVKEIISLLLFFMLAALFTYLDFSHYFTVKERRDEIQKKLIECVDQTDMMIVDYKRYIDVRVKAYRKQLEKSAPDDDIEDRENEVKELKAALWPESYETLKSKPDELRARVLNTKNESVGWWKKMLGGAKRYLVYKIYGEEDQESENESENDSASWRNDMWNRVKWHVMVSDINVAKDLKRESNDLRNLLIKRSKYRQDNEKDAKDYEGRLSIDAVINGVESRFKERGAPTMLAVCLAIFLIALMLLYYIFSKRYGGSSKFNILWLFGIKKPRKKFSAAADDTSIRL